MTSICIYMSSAGVYHCISYLACGLISHLAPSTTVREVSGPGMLMKKHAEEFIDCQW